MKLQPRSTAKELLSANQVLDIQGRVSLSFDYQLGKGLGERKDPIAKNRRGAPL